MNGPNPVTSQYKARDEMIPQALHADARMGPWVKCTFYGTPADEFVRIEDTFQSTPVGIKVVRNVIEKAKIEEIKVRVSIRAECEPVIP